MGICLTLPSGISRTIGVNGGHMFTSFSHNQQRTDALAVHVQAADGVSPQAPANIIRIISIIAITHAGCEPAF